MYFRFDLEHNEVLCWNLLGNWRWDGQAKTVSSPVPCHFSLSDESEDFCPHLRQFTRCDTPFEGGFAGHPIKVFDLVGKYGEEGSPDRATSNGYPLILDVIGQQTNSPVFLL